MLQLYSWRPINTFFFSLIAIWLPLFLLLGTQHTWGSNEIAMRVNFMRALLNVGSILANVFIEIAFSITVFGF